MQAITQAVQRHSALTHSRTLAICVYHSQLQQRLKWNPNYHTCHRSYSHQPKYHRRALSSSNQLWNRNLVRTGGLLMVGQDPAGLRTKITITSDYNGPLYYPSPAEFAYEYLEYINESYPWWLTIAMIAIGMRTCVTLPFSVYQHRVFARLENCQTEINTQAEQLKQKVISMAKLQKWSQQQVEDDYGKQVSIYKCVSYVVYRLHSESCGVLVSDNCKDYGTTTGVVLAHE